MKMLFIICMFIVLLFNMMVSYVVLFVYKEMQKLLSENCKCFFELFKDKNGYLLLFFKDYNNSYVFKG